MLISFIRTIILYVLTVVALRIMGKRQVGQLEPIELVVTLMISELASIPMGHVSIPLMHGVIPIVTLIAIEATLSYINLKSRAFRKLMSGVPTIIIQQGRVIEKELKRLRLNIDDLMEELRVSGALDIQDIEYAIFESNGNLSIIPRTDTRPIVLKDFHIEQRYKGSPFFLICDGKINEKALNILKKDEKWLKKMLESKDIKQISHVLFAGIDESGEFYCQRKDII